MGIMLSFLFSIIERVPLAGLVVSGIMLTIAALLLSIHSKISVYGDFQLMLVTTGVLTLFVRSIYYGSTMFVGVITYLVHQSDWQAYPQRIGEISVQVAYMLLLLMVGRHRDLSSQKISPAIGIAMLLAGMLITQFLRATTSSKEFADLIAGNLGTYLNLLLWLVIANRAIMKTDTTTQKLD
jgi:hypothetical protein